MKKTLRNLALAATFLTALCANAATGDYYLSGEFNNWPHTGGGDNYKFTQAGTTYTLDLSNSPTPDLSGAFLIVGMNSSGGDDWNNKICGVTNMVEGTEYTYVKNSGTNFSLKETVKNAVVTFDTSTGKIKITGVAQENDYEVVYVVGNINGSGWSENLTNYPLTPSQDDPTTFTGTFNFTAASNYCKLKAGAFVYGTGSSDLNVQLGQTYTAVKSGDSYVLGKGEYTFSYTLEKNADSGKLTITGSGEDVPVNYSSWYIAVVGDFNNNSQSANETQPTQEGITTFTNLPLGNSSFELKVWDGETDTWYNNNASGALKDGVAAVLVNNYGSKLSIEGSKAGDEYTLVFNCATKEITVTRTKEGDGSDVDTPVDYTSWTVNICGPWNDNTTYGEGSVYANPNSDGIVTFTQCTGLEQGFQIKTWDNQTDAWYNKTDSDVKPGEWVAVDNEYNSYIYIADAEAGQEYTVEFNCADNTVQVTLTKDVPQPTTPEITITESDEPGTNGKYSKAITVTLATDNEADKIYYTVDGTEPAEEDEKLYSEPITIANDTDLKVLAVREDGGKATATKSYAFEDTTAIGSILGDNAEGTVEVYDLSGRQIKADTLKPGMYIIRRGGEAQKVLVK